jgi:hypothetical protein
MQVVETLKIFEAWVSVPLVSASMGAAEVLAEQRI